MARISEEDIDRIKGETDLVALVQSRGIELKKHGSRDFIGLCPFHEDGQNPNFIVSPAKGLFHCMSCGAAGNAIQFIEKHDGISFRHAYELLANGSQAVFQPPRRRAKHSTAAKLACPLDPQADDATLLDQVVGYYQQRLHQSQAARDYLVSRGLDDEALVKTFRIGYADRTLGLRLPLKNRKEGAQLRERLQELGVFRKSSGHEHFNGSIVIPIFDANKQVSELYGRKIARVLPNGTPKHLYLPGPHRGIFNPQALTRREIILCESMIDALSFIRHGMDAATSIYGTEGFTEELFEAIKAHGIESVRIAYDADEPGERAAKRDAERLQAIGVECHRVRFPYGLDANAFALQQGGEALRQAVRSAEWLGAGAQTARNVTPPSSLAAQKPLAAKEQTQGATKKEGPTLIRKGAHFELTLGERFYRISGLEKNHSLEIMKITLRLRCEEDHSRPAAFHLDQLDLCKDQDRRRFMERAAEECRLEPELIKRDLGKLLLALEGEQEERLNAPLEGEKAYEMSAQEREQALALLNSPQLIDKITEAFDEAGVVGEHTNKIAAYLACTSRKLARPLAVIIQSTSAAGKTTLMEAVLASFPEEEQIKYSAMTGQSLYYLGETDLKHKIASVPPAVRSAPMA